MRPIRAAAPTPRAGRPADRRSTRLPSSSSSRAAHLVQPTACSGNTRALPSLHSTKWHLGGGVTRCRGGSSSLVKSRLVASALQIARRWSCGIGCLLLLLLPGTSSAQTIPSVLPLLSLNDGTLFPGLSEEGQISEPGSR